MREAGIEPSPASDLTPQPKRYLPIFLTRFDFLVNKSTLLNAPNQEDSTKQEYVVGIKKAAEYVGRSERTIKNWIKSLKSEGVPWLPVERTGKKMRFKKADLDKCRKQP